jgi:hypothetical protein
MLYTVNISSTARRRFPGNPLYNQNEQMTRCWNTTDGGEDSIIVHISDMCPCVQHEDSAHPTRVTGVNTPCCGDVYHVRPPLPPPRYPASLLKSSLGMRHSSGTPEQTRERTRAPPARSSTCPTGRSSGWRTRCSAS